MNNAIGIGSVIIPRFAYKTFFRSFLFHKNVQAHLLLKLIQLFMKNTKDIKN